MSFSAVRTCTQCGSKNRIPARHLSDAGRCGACKTELPATGEPIDVDAASFDEIVLEARVPVLVDFWAAWCGPCRVAAPEVKAVAQEMAGKAIVLKVDTERAPELAARFRVGSIPNFVVLRNGNVVLQQPGLVNRNQLRAWLQGAAASA